jgi:hypothetical protein
MRIGNDEREQAVRALGEHFAQGRLEPLEFEERMAAAYAARTADELDPLFADLPRAFPSDITLQYPAPGQPSSPVTHVAAHRPGVPDPQAPYGREPETGRPYSDRSKVVAGVLQLFFPIGLGRLYSGHAGIGIAQLVLAFFGIGMVWAFLDGIVILAGRPTDQYGRPLRP